MKRRSFIATVAAGAAALVARIKPPAPIVLERSRYIAAIDPMEGRDFWVHRLVIVNRDGTIAIVPYYSRLDDPSKLTFAHAPTPQDTAP